MQINSYNCHKIKNTKFTALVTDDLPILLKIANIFDLMLSYTSAISLVTDDLPILLKIANIFDLMLSYTSAIAGLMALAGNEIVPCSL